MTQINKLLEKIKNLDKNKDNILEELDRYNLTQFYNEVCIRIV